MQLSVLSVTVSIFLSGVLATPNAEVVPMNAGKSVTGAAGAAYFITNEPTGNFVVTADIMPNGQLSLTEAVATRGRGAHGIVAANGPDPLFSQGAVKASKNGKVLATVNAGSNTISLFAIDPKDPSKIKLIGKPISSGGEFPVSLTFNKAGTRLCALNGGKHSGVTCFSVDQRKGLAAISNGSRSINLNQITPANATLLTASHIIFNENETQLIVSSKATAPEVGNFAVWSVARDGSLSKDFKSLNPPAGGRRPFGMNLIPGSNAVLVADPVLGLTIMDLANPAKSTAFNITGQMAACWTSHSSKTGNFYLSDAGSSTIIEVNVDKNLKPHLIKQYPQTKNSVILDSDIASVKGNDFLYVLGANATQVQVLALNGPGAAKNLENVDISGPAKRAGLPISAFNLQGMTTFMKD